MSKDALSALERACRQKRPQDLSTIKQEQPFWI